MGAIITLRWHSFVLLSRLLTYSQNCGNSNELIKRCCARILALDIKEGSAKQLIQQSNPYFIQDYFIIVLGFFFFLYLFGVSGLHHGKIRDEMQHEQHGRTEM